MPLEGLKKNNRQKAFHSLDGQRCKHPRRSAKVVELQLHTYNIGDIVNIMGEQYEVTVATKISLDTGEAIYD